MRIGQNPAKSIDHVPQPEKVTIAVVTYIPFLGGYYAGSLEVLKACLESIQRNTECSYDLLVFDNASCPEVRDHLNEAQHQGRIQYLVLSDKNVGKGGAWNFIFQAAPGELIAYSDSDVLFYPGWLKRSLEIIQAFPKVGMVTARPMRTPSAYYSNTLTWAEEMPQVKIENGRFMAWETYFEHVTSLGTSEEQAREWYESRQDYRLTCQGVTAQIGAAHFQFTSPKAALQDFLPFNMDRPMGQVRSLDEQMNTAGYLRLGTTEALVKHMGNQLPEGTQTVTQSPAKKGSGKRLADLAPVKKSLLKVYDAIFRLYYR